MVLHFFEDNSDSTCKHNMKSLKRSTSMSLFPVSDLVELSRQCKYQLPANLSNCSNFMNSCATYIGYFLIRKTPSFSDNIRNNKIDLKK